VSHRDLGTATSAVNFFRSIGGTVGVALFGGIFSARFFGELRRLLPAELAGRINLQELSSTPGAIRSLPPQIRAAIVESIAEGVHLVFLAAVPMVFMAFVLAWFLREKPLADQAHIVRGETATGVPRETQRNTPESEEPVPHELGKPESKEPVPGPPA
jgi:hypothetical protein